ncbi:hypothetical protein [Chitinophaga eiseniae]|uniref:Uncharacterized protein n=1 Tax=Chitinophaga eiseniae TaxID=634771 RepID=A0A847S8X9_9BACT|nr:hypothetical protein [Chitinophaga eiseniae]NLR78251.1 hypothetical protein [Chitinophaga eiseniae]
MAILKHINRLKYMDFMIKRRATGDLDSFARKNGLCKRAMTGVIGEMKELGFPIKYDRARNTYYYEEEGQMVRSLFSKEGRLLTNDQLRTIGNYDKLCFSEAYVFEVCQEG